MQVSKVEMHFLHHNLMFQTKSAKLNNTWDVIFEKSTAFTVFLHFPSERSYLLPLTLKNQLSYRAWDASDSCVAAVTFVVAFYCVYPNASCMNWGSDVRQWNVWVDIGVLERVCGVWGGSVEIYWCNTTKTTEIIAKENLQPWWGKLGRWKLRRPCYFPLDLTGSMQMRKTKYTLV